MSRTATWLTRRVPVRGIARLALRELDRGERVAGYAGARLRVAAHNPPEVSAYLWGRYEDEVTAAVRAGLRPGDTAIDVGANCGVLTILMRVCVGPRGVVVAVDPSAVATGRVTEQAELNGFDNVHVVNVGLGRSPGRERFYSAAVGIGALPDADRIYTTGEGEVVEVETLDALAAAHGIERVSFIKLDTDGSEADILDGARMVLERDGPLLVFEATAEHMDRRGQDPARLARLLEQHRYALLRPVLRARRPWLAGPSRVERFEDLAVADLPRYADGANLLGWRPEDPHHRQVRDLLVRPRDSRRG